MRCGNCGYGAKEDWEFCPRCRSRLRRFSDDFFGDVFSRMEKEIKEMDKVFNKNFEVFDLSPFFRKNPRTRGFSISIRQGSDDKPKISVKTFGDVEKRQIEEGMEKLGLEKEKPEKVLRLRMPKITEEPKTQVKRLGNSLLVDVELPGVGSERDIEIKVLESSVEIKALAGDKAYFKILTKPAELRLTKRSFERGVLHLKLS